VITCPACGAANREGARFCDTCAAPLTAAPPPREQRKTVTVLQSDVTGSTALGQRLDPESLRAALARYFEISKAVIERHGGTVEKFIGDAVLAVFGVPVVHEDDALRAVRAAADIRDAIAQLNDDLVRDYGVSLTLRIGVNTGEVVTGTAERLATGDAVVVAARLEQGAPPGEILLGEETVRLVRGSVEVGPFEHVQAKGKTQPLAAYRLLAVSHEAPQRSHDAPFVGRERERTLLAGAWERARAEHTAYFFTVLGTAGVGKSRLAAEFLSDLGGDSRVVRGRCLSYGEGITYWPVVEILKQLLGARPAASLEEFVLDETAAASLLGLLGKGEQPESPEIVAWSFRKLLEAVAESTPLVLVLDDLQWADATLLDLVEHVADLSREAPMLLLCLARPDLLDRRPGWGGGKLNATTVLLEPLPADDCERLIDALLVGAPLGDDVRARILAAADGNPLFVEEMLALIRERDGDGEVDVPPSIHALLAARLDQLDPSERSVLERGSVEGKVFHRGAVQALAPDEREVPTRLVSLVRKELVRPDRTLLVGDDAYRFRHLLIRDAAYEALPKSARAELHERFADWLEEHGAQLVELDEILGYHLQQAHRYRLELGPADERTERLAVRAAAALTEAADRANARGDSAAETTFLGRAVGLSSDVVVTARSRLRLAKLLFVSDDPNEAALAASRVRDAARDAGDTATELLARCELAREGLWTSAEGATAELESIAREAIPLFEAAGDNEALVETWEALATVAWVGCRYGEALTARRRRLDYARHTGRARLEREALSQIGPCLYFGPTPAAEALAWFEDHPLLAARPGYTWHGQLLGQLARFDAARVVLDEGEARARELGDRYAVASWAIARAEVELLAGDLVEAERWIRAGCETFEELGQLAVLSTYATLWARTLWMLGRDDDAMAKTERSEALGASDDVITQAAWRQERARVLARRGEHLAAERLAREAVARVELTDMPVGRAEALEALADVLELGGDAEGTAAALEQALAEYTQKGVVPAIARTEARLAALRAPA
jgi:class 3 adenylate cyclase